MGAPKIGLSLAQLVGTMESARVLLAQALKSAERLKQHGLAMELEPLVTRLSTVTEGAAAVATAKVEAGE